jgi:Ca2+/H+ antiporter
MWGIDEVGDQSDEVVEGVEGSKWISIKAVLLLILGTLIAAAFADPLVDAVDNFSDASGIPTFFISFIALPLATNSSEAVTAIIFASRDKRRTASLTFSEVCFLFPLSLYTLSAYTIFSEVNVDTFFFFLN